MTRCGVCPVRTGRRSTLEIEDGLGLSPEEKQQLVRGFAYAADGAMAACGSRAVTVVVESVDHVESDYQPKGLAVAMLRWLEEEFSLPVHDIQVSFDRKANRSRIGCHAGPPSAHRG